FLYCENARLSIHRSGDSLTYSFDDSEDAPVLEVIHLSRSDFEDGENSEELQSYMVRSDLDSVEKFAKATLYITDSNTIGSSGLFVFEDDRSKIVKMSFVMGPTNTVLR